ncbi:MAG: twin-arginine translocase subunit TatC [Desulfurococcales archaeon]|nr:twin-arginine translocase subunit TatC [Desulfurococcales archaeon]
MEKPPRDVEADIWTHVVELATRLRRIALAVIALTFILSSIPLSINPYVPLIKVFPNMIIGHVTPDKISFMGKTYNVELAQFNPFAGFNVLLKSAILLGVLGASPIIAREIFEYIKPALYPHEERIIKRLSIVSVALFMGGALLAYFVVVPLALRIMFLTSIVIVGDKELVAFADVERLFTLIIQLIIATGIMFEIPLIVYIVVSNGIIEPERFKGDTMKYIFLVSMIIGAIISPDPTGLGMMMIGVPYYLLFYVAVKLGERNYYRKRMFTRELQRGKEEEIAVPARS